MDIGFALTVLGLVAVLAGAIVYLILLFVVHGFTYRTWIFHATVATGVVMAVIGVASGGSAPVALFAIAIGIAWLIVAWRELRITGSKRLALRPGDLMPAFAASTTDASRVTEQDLAAKAPVLLVLYRGWWCPSSKTQLDEVVRSYEQLRAAGLTVFAGSVDGPAEAAPLQHHVGDRVTILCDIPISLLETIGVRDERGAPWYDRLLFGAPKRDISMPAALVIDGSGRVLFAHRSTRVDDRPRPADILASLRSTARGV